MGPAGPNGFVEWVRRFVNPLHQPTEFLSIRCKGWLCRLSKCLIDNQLLVALGGKPKAS